MSRSLPSLAGAKALAKSLRLEKAKGGNEMSHAAALELIAHQHGYRDWNAFHAAIRDLAPEAWQTGGRVSGRYLSQPFTATVASCEALKPGWFRLVLDLDEAVDVVRFESFSNMRKQLRVVVGPNGETKERTSDGVPHLILNLHD